MNFRHQIDGTQKKIETLGKCPFNPRQNSDPLCRSSTSKQL